MFTFPPFEEKTNQQHIQKKLPLKKIDVKSQVHKQNHSSFVAKQRGALS
jgi:hypothetical protein